MSTFIASSGDDAWRKHRARSICKRPRGARKAGRKQATTDDVELLPSGDDDGAPLVKEQSMSLSKWVPDLLSLSKEGDSTFRPIRVAKFAYGYFGRSAEASSGLMLTFSYWQSPHFNAMKAAGNALGLLYVATWLHNPQVLFEARKAHAAAANILRQEVEKPRVNFMAVLGAAEALISCEAYSLVSSGPTVTTTHLSGIMEVVRSTTHQAATARIRSFLFRKFRHLSLMQSLVSRRALAGEHIWWICSAVQPSSSVENLMQLAVQLPALLETAEIVRRSCEPDERIVKGVRSRLLRLEVDLAEWLSENDSMAEETATQEEHDNELEMEIAVYGMQTRPVVTVPALQFSSFLGATCHAFYWVCLLLLRQALLALPQRRSETTSPRNLVADINATADHLCASIPYLANTAGGVLNKGVSVRAPLHFASEWFEQNQNELKLQWCRETEVEWQKQLPFLQW